MDDIWEEEANPWRVLGVRQLSENPWFAVEAHDAIDPAGKPAVYNVIRQRKIAVGALPIEADGTVHLVGQWRFPIGRYSWEIPEGGGERDEAPEVSARRELAEETGLRAGRLLPILQMDISNATSDEIAYIFLATDLTAGDSAPEEVEVLQRRSAPFREVLARVVDGRIRDAITVAAVLRTHHMAVTGELPPALAEAILA